MFEIWVKVKLQVFCPNTGWALPIIGQWVDCSKAEKVGRDLLSKAKLTEQFESVFFYTLADFDLRQT